jgi:uncharacterized membrane protein SpoIIM required for sporulation
VIRGKTVIALDFWKYASSRGKRIFTIIGFLFLSLIITVAGVLTPLSPEDADAISEETDQTRKVFESMHGVQRTAFVFGNNLMICLVIFVPVLGPMFGCYVLYNTGVVIAADSIAANVNPLLYFVLLFVFPFAWLEFIAYSAAFATSFWLTWRIIQRRLRSEIVTTGLFISICAVTLLLAAVIEIAMIALLE